MGLSAHCGLEDSSLLHLLGTGLATPHDGGRLHILEGWVFIGENTIYLFFSVYYSLAEIGILSSVKINTNMYSSEHIIY